MSPPAISLPKGGGAIGGIGEKFSVNPVTGTGSFSVPIFTTPSRSDFYAKLSLSYDSGAGNGPFGLGWNLSVPSVTRKTERGLPKYRDADDSDVFILSEAEDLVPALILSDGKWNRDVRVDTADGRTFTVQRYRPRTEGLFARIERWQDLQSDETFWKSISKDNVTSLYGRTPGSRIADPEDTSRVFKWLLEETRDDKGNVTQYEYKQEDRDNIDPSLPQEGNNLSNGNSFANCYLKYIKYGNSKPYSRADWLFQVVFDYGEHDLNKPTMEEVAKWRSRPDPFSSFRSGFEIRTYRLCQRVLMFHQFQELGATPCLVRSTDLSHAENPVATYLTSVTQTGYIWDNQSGDYQKKSFPPLEFTYSQPTVDPEIHFIDADSLENLPIGLDQARYQWVDLDSEGISGILFEQPEAWYYKPNRGNAQFAPVELLAAQPSLASPGSGRQQLMDLAGDGEKCLVQFSEPVAGFYERDEAGEWGPFTPFVSNPNISWNDPNLKVLDLDGDGFSDVLISGDEVFTWYPSLAKQGFGPAQTVRREEGDEEKGPALVFADSTQSVFLADMCGDGLTDIARIRNGEVCYWPNMGYGRFGPKVTMDAAPVFDHPECFDPKRIRLVDIDGSGTTDIIYLGRDSVTFWSNQAGNGWSDAQTIPNFPPTDDLSSVTAVDLFGNGTGCIVWSSPLPQDAGEPMRYIDLMSGQKPHLLVAINNSMGSEIRLQYASSTKFYLEDLAADTPWITKLPFPVQVLEHVETRDEITGTKLVSLYKYHHGYYDGIEREFRGFGLVEQWDTEHFAQFVGVGLFPNGPNAVDEELHVPPVHTKTWFHTGAFLDRNNISQHFVDEYYKGDSQAILLPDTGLPTGLTAQEEEEACRALKGRMLRQEIYADDSSPSNVHPYAASEHTYEIQLIQPVQDNPHAVFFGHDKEALDYHYERNPANPRISHVMTLEVNDFGNVTKSVAIGYPRRAPAYPEQAQTVVTYTESDVINVPNAPDFYRIGVPFETRTYELTGVAQPASLFTVSEVQAGAQNAVEIPYEAGATLGLTQKRLIERARSLYYKDDLSGPLPLGLVESHALLYETYKMAFTPGLLTQVYGNRVTDALLAGEGKYHLQDGVWWIPSGQQIFDPAQFYLPVHSTDPFGNTSTITYDAYSLLITEVVDPLANTASAQNSYRTIQPWHLTDPNNNRSAVRFDALGMVVATALMGKQGQNEGDTLDGTTPEASASDDPTTKLEYDLFNWVKNQRPNFVHTLAREQHGGTNLRWQESYGYSDGFGRELMKKIQAEAGPAPARDQNGILKRDGNGKLALEFTNARWVGTGRTVFNNKGKPVKKYEPFFSSTNEYEDEKDLVDWGVTAVLHHDPLERVIRTDLPDGTFSRVEFDPWQHVTSDQNDTVLESQWYAQRGSPTPTDPEPSDPEKRAAWLAAKHADTPAIAHLDTLGRAFLTIADNGRATDGTPQIYPTRVELDIEGNQRSVTDALGRKMMVYDYDMLGKRIHQASMEAGEQWLLNDVAGKAIGAWDSRGHNFRTAYDALRRPTNLFVHGTDPNNSDPRTLNGEVLFDKTVYGEGQPNDQTLNLRTRVFRHYDSAGVVTSMGHNGITNQDEAYDFKGNLLRSSRQLLEDYKSLPDWSGAMPNLRQEVFTTSTQYDALNRVVASTTPDRSVFRPTYNEANLLERIDVNLRGAQAATPFVANIDYSAKGQRELIEYGNGAKTDYTYDPKTFRLTDLVTHRDPASFPNDCPQPPNPPCGVQNLHYVYDPVGNITFIRDDAQQTVFFNNAKVEPSANYTYDAVYRLIAAAGREHQGQLAQPQTTWDDTPRVNQPLPTDGQAMRNYSDNYTYDPMGNFAQVIHQAVNGNWTRTYAYDEPSLIEPGKYSNRLTSAAVGASTDLYQYDAQGNVTKIPHLTLMQWDHRNQLQATASQLVNTGTPQTTYYIYDSTGQRVRKVTESAGGVLLKERFYLVGFEMYREYEANGATVSLERETLHVMDDKRRVAFVDTKTVDTNAAPFTPTPFTRYQFDNHLGSAVLELNDAGAIISYEEYYAYGSTSYQAVNNAIEVSPRRYRYTGKERDEESGLYYHGARYYAPWLGRWTSCDPAGMVDGTNIYAFTRGNPLVFTDKTGTNVDPPLHNVEAQPVVGTPMPPSTSKNDVPVSTSKAADWQVAQALRKAVETSRKTFSLLTNRSVVNMALRLTAASGLSKMFPGLLTRIGGAGLSEMFQPDLFAGSDLSHMFKPGLLTRITSSWRFKLGGAGLSSVGAGMGAYDRGVSYRAIARDAVAVGVISYFGLGPVQPLDTALNILHDTTSSVSSSGGRYTAIASAMSPSNALKGLAMASIEMADASAQGDRALQDRLQKYQLQGRYGEWIRSLAISSQVLSAYVNRDYKYRSHLLREMPADSFPAQVMLQSALIDIHLLEAHRDKSFSQLAALWGSNEVSYLSTGTLRF